MPPKARITKEEIVSAALDLVRDEGALALNARAVAKRLGCSTQPVFSSFAKMEDLRADIIVAAKCLYQEYIRRGMEDPNYPPYKSSGMAYIRFAKEERELFRLLFMRDRNQKEMDEEKDDISQFVKLLSETTGMSEDDAFMFHIEMWIYVHGIATMIVTSYLDWDWETISTVMSDGYLGLKLRYENREEK